MSKVEQAVQIVLDELIESGYEVGLQAAAYIDGELAVDCTAGIIAQDSEVPATSDTLFTIYSCSKGVSLTCAHILAERGLIDYQRPLAEYWPDFAVQGKERITVAEALNHLAGILRISVKVATCFGFKVATHRSAATLVGLGWVSGFFPSRVS